MAKKAILTLYSLTVLVVLFNTGYNVHDYLFADINELPQGEYQYSIVSPDERNKMNVYVVKNSIGTAVRGELETKDGVSNIFWQTGIDSADVVWNGDEVMVINGIPVDSEHPYDCRRGTSLFTEGSLMTNLGGQKY